VRVKVGNKFYDSRIEPIMLVLSNSDKYEINHLKRDEHCMCYYPKSMTEKQVDVFMDTEEWREDLGKDLVRKVYSDS
jgi:hypothetical protein